MSSLSEWILWGLFDPRELWTLDALRDKYGPCIVNDWSWGGNFSQSGFRPAATMTGAEYSQHRFGRATDKKFSETDVVQIIEDMHENPDDPAFKYITCVEETINNETPTWLHTDVRNKKPNGGGITFLQL